MHFYLNDGKQCNSATEAVSFEPHSEHKAGDEMNSDDTFSRFYVISGGPGSGKTSLLDALESEGFCRTQEAGRSIIQQQVAIGGRALPWGDRLQFAELMLNWETRSYQMAQATTGLVFFDRGVPDVAGYLRLENIAIPSHVRKAVELFRYNQTVFMAPPWPEIYRQDRERKQDFAEAVRTYECLRATYESQDYRVQEIPCTSIEERVRFILRMARRTVEP